MVLVYSDDYKLMLEMLNKGSVFAKDTKKSLIAVVIGEDKFSSDYISHGADKVVVVDTDFSSFKVEEYADILEGVIKDDGSDVVLIGSNKNGKELAPRVAAKFKTGCITDCTDIYFKDGSLVAERIVYSGNAVAVEKFSHTPYIVTVPSKLFEPLPKDDKRKGEVVKKKVDFEKSKSKIVKVTEKKSEGVNVEDADIIVSCGRGLKDKNDLKLISDLADVLKGNTVGCSRPIAADLKWLSEDHWIGLSGRKVKPKLYIAAGISGQIQHIAGMRDSGVIVAINKDPEALIFKSADYGIVGDLYEVLPKLIDAIKSKMG